MIEALLLAARNMQCNAGSEGTLYDFPISNNGGRVRVVIYDKGIQDRIRLVAMRVWVLSSLLCGENEWDNPRFSVETLYSGQPSGLAASDIFGDVCDYVTVAGLPCLASSRC